MAQPRGSEIAAMKQQKKSPVPTGDFLRLKAKVKGKR
jgi:hypothetical protein